MFFVADVELRLRGGSYEPWRAGVVYGGLAVLLLVGLVGVAPGLVRTMPRALLPNGLKSDAHLAKVSDTYRFLGAAAEHHRLGAAGGVLEAELQQTTDGCLGDDSVP